jgi:hypothetical protein
MGERWLLCKIVKGMFSDELAVLVRTTSGEEVSVFVPRDRVQGSVDEEGRVKIRSFEAQSKLWAVLPNETQTVIPVDAGQLQTA